MTFVLGVMLKLNLVIQKSKRKINNKQTVRNK